MASIDVLVSALRDARATASDVQHRREALLNKLNAPRAICVALSTAQLYEALTTFESTIANLRALAAALDCEFGDHVIASLDELILHLRTLGILSQIEQLSQAAHDLTTAPDELFAGKFQSVGDVAAFVYDRISGMWLQYSHVASPSTEAVSSRLDRRDIIRQAQNTLTTIGRDADIVHLLRAGMARPDWSSVFCACMNIAELLAITIDVEPDAALFQAAPAPELIDSLPPLARAGLPIAMRKR
jgi:hypothetical protein